MKIIYTYILRQLITTLVFAMIALSIIFIVVNLMESLDDFLDKQAPFLIIVKYYLYYLPDILRILTPVAMLISVLFTIGRLSTMNEITAMKSGGMSLYRLMIPLSILGLLISVFQLYFNGWIVPIANQKKFGIERKFLNKKNQPSALTNVFLRDNPNRILTMQFYEINSKIGTKVSIEDFSSETNPRLIKRIEASNMVWDTINNNWKLNNIIERNYNNNKVEVITFTNKSIELNITHKKIIQLKRLPEEMNFDEQKEYIEILRIGGKDIRKMLIEYYGNYAFPFANFIVMLFGVPFAFDRKKGGIAIQIAAAMIVSFLYLIFTKVSQTLGFSMNMNPILTGWFANFIFLAVGIINIFKTKT